jgi:putative glutamine amidotransferase
MAFIPSFYIDAVEKSGGVAVLLPPQRLSPLEAWETLQNLDGLVVTGGRDLNPARYGQESAPLTDEPDLLRDETEATLLKAAIDNNFPFLGICRGAQLLNVVMGGTLIQHLPDVIGTEKYQIEKGVFNPVPVQIEPGNKLFEMVGSEVSNALMYHHQSVDQLGKDLVVTARTTDGVIEGLELPNHRFGVAVQWHPEQDLEDLRIFTSFIKATKTA